MNKLITQGDIIDIAHKLKQRGLGFLLEKIHLNGTKRTENTFNHSEYSSADWWIIPKVKERWNEMISGSKFIDYKEFFVKNYLSKKSNLRLISLGSGSSNREIDLAKYSNFKEIICVDLAEDRLAEARARAEKLNLTNIKFICTDFNEYKFEKDSFDIVFFHASLHHFNHIENFLKNKVKPCLKPNGLLIINEYVGATRLQFPKQQIIKINEALSIIPKKYRYRNKSNILKSRFYGSGIIRMILADPSECIDSQNIMPTIHSNFKTIVEKPYGGNLLMNVLKDISHHFVKLDNEKEQILYQLFSLEDEYLKEHSSDFIFGIYSKDEHVNNINS